MAAHGRERREGGGPGGAVGGETADHASRREREAWLAHLEAEAGWRVPGAGTPTTLRFA